MYQLEDTHAWYVSLRKKVFSYITAYRRDAPITILDTGCGTGALLLRLKNMGRSIGVDVSETAIELCQQRGLNNIIRSSVLSLPFRDDSFDIVTSVDVLYHQKVVNDNVALREYYRVLKRSGILILNLPAYEFLKGEYDKAIHIFRRYRMGDMKIKVKEAGFSIERIIYSNTFLFPIIAIWRLFICGKIVKENNKSDLYSLLKL